MRLTHFAFALTFLLLCITGYLAWEGQEAKRGAMLGGEGAAMAPGAGGVIEAAGALGRGIMLLTLGEAISRASCFFFVETGIAVVLIPGL